MQQTTQLLVASLCLAGLLIAVGGGINDLNPFFMIDPSKDREAQPTPHPVSAPLPAPIPWRRRRAAASSGSLSEGA